LSGWRKSRKRILAMSWVALFIDEDYKEFYLWQNGHEEDGITLYWCERLGWNNESLVLQWDLFTQDERFIRVWIDEAEVIYDFGKDFQMMINIWRLWESFTMD
jgi:hypothetical protein